MNYTSKTLTAVDDYTSSFSPSGDGCVVVITSAFTGTLTIQRAVDTSGTFRNLVSYTSIPSEAPFVNVKGGAIRVYATALSAGTPLVEVSDA